MTGWAKFWEMLLSPATARFILALLALGLAASVMWGLMTQQVDERNREPLLIAVGIVMNLASVAFGYYFGSTARGDAKPSDPVTKEEQV
jgi:F0F1-type ATP synthase membrane subunit c/vacuolar-type H+-ATPase subunit K